jgi:hypothetical protein
MALFLLVIGWKLVHSGITYHNKLYLNSLNRENDDTNTNAALLPSNPAQALGRLTPEDTHKQYLNLDKDLEVAENA